MNPFDIGRLAGQVGLARTDNPYPEESAGWAAWDHGWLDAYYIKHHG